jgi:hypothetical protein
VLEGDGYGAGAGAEVENSLRWGVCAGEYPECGFNEGLGVGLGDEYVGGEGEVEAVELAVAGEVGYGHTLEAGFYESGDGGLGFGGETAGEKGEAASADAEGVGKEDLCVEGGGVDGCLKAGGGGAKGLEGSHGLGGKGQGLAFQHLFTGVEF